MTTSRAILLGAVLVGVLLGLSGYTFIYARGYAYLSNDPGACANCHVMRDHFVAWTRASHRAVAVCNDCHTPPELIGTYITKARNGFWHSFYFTTGRYPDPLRITARNHDVTERTCRRCHAELASAIDPVHGDTSSARLSCTRCHNHVGHIE